MPRRDDLKKILIIGSGPIVIGQACEFDYSGTQACKALREEGYEVVLVNSNPATIMTDPATADRTYIEPLTWEIVAKVIEKERPDALLPTLGGQTGLNVAMDLWRHGVLEKYGVEMIGANADVIDKAESRERFQTGDAEDRPRYCPRARRSQTIDEARALARRNRPAGRRAAELHDGRQRLGDRLSTAASSTSWSAAGSTSRPSTQVLIEESIIGWKEYEMEVMRDKDDNVVIICSIENFDPMGIHTGDSITVAPAQTLTDKEYQRMRDASLAVIREIGVETGGSNIQFAIHPEHGADDRHRDESAREPLQRAGVEGDRFSDREDRGQAGRRLSAARAAERHHARNDGLLRADDRLRGDESAAVRVREISRGRRHAHDADEERRRDDGHRQHVQGIVPEGAARAGSPQRRLRLRPARPVGHRPSSRAKQEIVAKLTKPGAERVWYLRYAFKSGMSVAKVYELTGIDPWFLDNLHEIVETEEALRKTCGARIAECGWRADCCAPPSGKASPIAQLARIFGTTEMDVRAERLRHGIRATFKSVDTCAAEFEAYTPYYYSTYEDEDEVPPKPPGKKRIMILGGGPNRIGQGIEFDYCCCHASFALQGAGHRIGDGQLESRRR